MSGIEKASYKGGFKRRQLKSYTRRFIAIVGISFALLGGSLQAEFVYVANADSNTVSAYRIAENGALTPVARSPFPAGSEPYSVAVDPLGGFVYVANGGSYPLNSSVSGSVSGYRIAANGALKPVPRSPFPAGSFSLSVAVDPLDRFVYVATSGSYPAFNGSVSGYRIAANGALKPVAGSPFTAGILPFSVAVDISGRFVSVANADSNTISAYSIRPDGALTPVAGSPFPAGSEPISVAVDPLGRFVYVANYTSNTVSACSIGLDGALTPVAGSPFPGFPISVAVDPLDRFVYVANESSNNISGYRIGADGALTPVAGSSPAGSNPRSVAVDISGRFVYVANAGSGTVSAYSIDPASGALTAVLGSPFPAGLGANSVAFSP
jgi:6-phosphogluconolactonase